MFVTVYLANYAIRYKLSFEVSFAFPMILTTAHARFNDNLNLQFEPYREKPSMPLRYKPK